MTERLPRLATGIPGLDRILDGGFIDGASYIIEGRPGVGKTIFCNQVSFAHAARGGRVLYVTLLAEAHERLFQSLGTLSFFDASRLGNGVSYVSVFQTLLEEGLPAVVDLLRQETLRQGASLLVFDGLLNARHRADSELDIKRFVAAVQNQAAFVNCTVLFLTSTRLVDDSPEHTMVDGVIDLHSELAGVRSIRSLEVRKSRGSACLAGTHEFLISDDGVTVYPRIEAAFGRVTPGIVSGPALVASGVDGLDALIGGGLAPGSITLLMGPSGAGKTSFGLGFLSASTTAAPGLHFGFYETPDRLHAKSAALGMPLDDLVETGALELVRHPLGENLLDELGYALLDAVRLRGAKRLFIDAVGGFERAAVQRERMVEFLSALFSQLRALGVTVIATWETRDLLGRQFTGPMPEIASSMDNLMVLRSSRTRTGYRRVLSVLKVRDCPVHPAMHEVIFDGRGLRVSPVPRSSDGLELTSETPEGV